MLALRDVHTYYGESYILQGVSLEVGDGEAVALLGRNGVGKTTTMRSIMGFTPPRRGQIVFREQPIERAPAYRIAGLGIGLVPQGRRIFPELSVRENLTMSARRKPGGWDLERVYRLFPRLKERERHWGNQLSGGEQQMLAIGRALMTNPILLLMDEPSEGLAPIIVDEIGRTVRELKREGFAILLVEQNLSLALGVADRVYVMNKGQIVFHGPPADLLAAEAVKRQYLGV